MSDFGGRHKYTKRLRERALMQPSVCTIAPTVVGRIIYVIDDDAEFRSSMHFLMSTRKVVVSPFASGTNFLDDLPNLSPAPILLDIRMPRLSGVQVVAELATRGELWPLIVLTGHGDVGLAVETLKLGAIDFLEKPTDPELLIAAVDGAFKTLAAKNEADQSRALSTQSFAKLTPREREVIDLLCDGLLNKQVAAKLAISPRTVEMHRANALRNFGVRSIVEIAMLRNSLKATV